MRFAPGALLVIAFVVAFAVASRPDDASPSDAAVARVAAPGGVQPLHAVAALPVALRVVPLSGASDGHEARVARSRSDEARARAARARRDEARSRAVRSRRAQARSRATRWRRDDARTRAARPQVAQSATPRTADPPLTASQAPSAAPAPVVAPRPVATAPRPAAAPKPRGGKRFDSSGGFDSEG